MAGINHDSTSNTVDLVSKYTLLASNGSKRFDDTTANSAYYENSTLKTYVDSIANAFSPNIVQTLMDICTPIGRQNNSGVYIYSTLHDKIKIPSTIELGLNTKYGNGPIEGTTYEIFGGKISTEYADGMKNTLAKINYNDKPGNTYAVYWTRTCIGGPSNINVVTELGECMMISDLDHYVKPYYKCSIVAIIRFGKK